MVAAVGEAKVLEGGWVDPPPPPTRLGVGGGRAPARRPGDTRTYPTPKAFARTQYVLCVGPWGQAALRLRHVPNAGGWYA
eukprot:CAMPEP_0118810174 /NCGR_PEP_ID=MMETSP1162-20130426/800_1 /TAXON_ID=33656 /ORGANISM="Phaeocystis Sp, Strain CCMP2710" /LENGTH=79 /DNA_ID=CAMNT_0006739665 /DNA_START=109 /DNA_END=348 /DNA_ORIENTATION=-